MQRKRELVTENVEAKILCMLKKRKTIPKNFGS